MIKIVYGFIEFAICMLKILYLPMKMLPVQKKITFISRQTNTPGIDFVMIQDAIKKEHPEYRVVMFTRKTKNIFLYCIHVVQQMYHIATSKTVIIDRYCIPVCVLNHRKSFCVLQIWHALGSMKHFGYDMIDKEEGHTEEMAKVMRMHKNYTYILISSYHFIRDFLTGFRAEPATIKEIPLPKADCLVSKEYKEKKRKELFAKYPELEGKEIILYCPTYRKFPSLEDEVKMNELLNKIDYDRYHVIYSAHPLSRIQMENPRVKVLEEGTFDALFISDHVISDYSSVIYEAGLLKLPVYLYAYDWNDFHERRTFNIDFEKDVPALFTDSAEEIVRSIEMKKFDYEAFERFTNDNIRMPKGTCCEEILKLINF